MKNRANPLVSVIIPTYQRKKGLIKRAVESVLNQSYKNLEIIIIDDNLSDSNHTKDLLLMLEEVFYNEPRIKYFKNTTNIGGALSRNNGN